MDKLIELIAGELRKIFVDNGCVWAGKHVHVILLALLSTGLLPTTYKLLKFIYDLLKKRKLESDLHPFYDKTVTDKAVDLFVQTKCQNIDPARENEPKESFAFATKEKLIPFFINKAFRTDRNEQRYYFVLADSGMGKTTFMINLFTRYQNKFIGKKHNIILLPLGDDKVDEFIDKISEAQQRNTILLLDGLDDDPKAWNNHKKRLGDILSKIRLFRVIVITSRTQFFASAAEEPYETGIRKYDTDGGGQYVFNKMYISPFDEDDINAFLNKKFGKLPVFNWEKKNLARLIVNKSPNLMVRPMLLSFIDDLVSTGDDSVRSAPVKYTYTYEIYEVLIDKWLQREAKRVPVEKRYDFIENLYYFSNQVALLMCRGSLLIEASHIVPLARSFEIELEELDLKGRSLLNRNLDGKFKFAHKSIFEYFLAANAYQNRNIAQTPGGMTIVASLDLYDFDLAKSFFVEMCFGFKKYSAVFDGYGHPKRGRLEDREASQQKLIIDILGMKYKDTVPEWIDSRTLFFKKIELSE